MVLDKITIEAHRVNANHERGPLFIKRGFNREVLKQLKHATECSYKSGDEWKNTSFVQDGQIQTLRKLLDEAHSFILRAEGKVQE